MATFPSRMFVKNTTKITLNERFTAYRQQQAQTQVFRQKLQTQRQASVESRRLAQQMANRPSVIAALRLKNRSIQQRLGRRPGGGNIKARLNLSGRGNTTSLRNRLGNVRGRGVPRRGGFRPGTSPLIKARLGAPSGSNYGTQFRQPQRMGFRQKRRGNFNRQAQGGFRPILRASSNKSMRGKAIRGGGGRGRGRWNKSVSALPTRQELDNQLDEYMAETKSSLDAELNHYMKTEGF